MAMIDETKMAQAKKVYQTLCEAIERRNWKFGKDEEKLLVHFGVRGEDLLMQFILIVDAERQLIRLLSPMPNKMSEGKRMEGAIATCAASYGLVDGSFDYNLPTGEIIFRMTASFRSSEIGEGMLQYMISCACAVVDKYNDQFLGIDKGEISIADFIATRY
ncbi:MAG: hypothetical protein IJO72_06240 [Oscillospiraceae bacterium]|nr:hypothetical protein [Oscillospiraceae bacterium]